MTVHTIVEHDNTGNSYVSSLFCSMQACASCAVHLTATGVINTIGLLRLHVA